MKKIIRLTFVGITLATLAVVLAANTAFATDAGAPTANLTWVTEPAASTASSEQNASASASDVRSAPPNANSKHSAAADTDLVIRWYVEFLKALSLLASKFAHHHSSCSSLKAMAVGLLLALSL